MNAGIYLEAANRDLDHDQHHDRDFEPERALGVDDVGQRIRRRRHSGELALERIEPLLQFVLVFEAGIEPVELGLDRKSVV